MHAAQGKDPLHRPGGWHPHGGLQNVTAVSDYLGNEPFFMGERPTTVQSMRSSFFPELTPAVPR